MGLETFLNKRILIADDLPGMRADLLRILKTLGFSNIKEVTDGQEAWEELNYQAQNGSPYDIIFSDINMPIMNGLALLKAARTSYHYKLSPFFIVSTENERDIIVKAIINGATDYIIKPYVLETLKIKLEQRLK